MLPSTNVLGAYSGFAQYIELSSVTSGELTRALNGNVHTAASVSPLLAHEACHWMDHLSSLWGRRRLVASRAAIHARDGNNPNDFWQIAAYRRMVARDHFDEYYSTIGRSDALPGDPRIWKWRLTAGLRFDASGRMDESSPIFFTQFAWPDGVPACRVPFSVAALLECNAMNHEWLTHLAVIERLSEEDRLIEAGLATERNLRLLYQPEAAKYTAAVHLVGNILGIADVMRAFDIASAIASLCLNLPDGCFDTLKIPDAFAAFGKRNDAAIRQRDLGYAFLAITHHALPPENGLNRDWLNRVCSRAGLPSVEEIERQSEAESQSVLATAKLGAEDRMVRTLWEAGNVIREKMGFIFALREGKGAATGTPLPAVVCSDLKWVVPTPCPLDRTDAEAEARILRCVGLARQFDEFIGACSF